MRKLIRRIEVRRVDDVRLVEPVARLVRDAWDLDDARCPGVDFPDGGDHLAADALPRLQLHRRLVEEVVAAGGRMVAEARGDDAPRANEVGWVVGVAEVVLREQVGGVLGYGASGADVEVEDGADAMAGAAVHDALAPVQPLGERHEPRLRRVGLDHLPSTDLEADQVRAPRGERGDVLFLHAVADHRSAPRSGVCAAVRIRAARNQRGRLVDCWRHDFVVGDFLHAVDAHGIDLERSGGELQPQNKGRPLGGLPEIPHHGPRLPVEVTVLVRRLRILRLPAWRSEWHHHLGAVPRADAVADADAAHVGLDEKHSRERRVGLHRNLDFVVLRRGAEAQGAVARGTAARVIFRAASGCVQAAPGHAVAGGLLRREVAFPDKFPAHVCGGDGKSERKQDGGSECRQRRRVHCADIASDRNANDGATASSESK